MLSCCFYYKSRLASQAIAQYSIIKLPSSARYLLFCLPRRVAAMSTANVTTDVFMSSSPPRPSRITPQTVASSSPDLPSLSEIFAKHPRRPPLKRGNNATSLPVASAAATNSIPPTFTNAATLLREAPEIDIDTEKITKSPLKPKSVNGLLEKLISSAQSSNEDPFQSSPEKQPAAILIESSPREEKPWQKFKSRTPTPEAKKPPIPNARISKANSTDKQRDEQADQDEQDKLDKLDKPSKPSKPKQARPATGTVSKHFTSKKASTQLSRTGLEIKEPADYSKPDPRLESTANVITQSVSNTTSCSEPALRRRVDWTPPPADSPIIVTSDSDHKEFISSADDAPSAANVFQTLHDSFTYKHDNTPSGAQRQPPQRPQEIQSDFLKKRKRIDMLPTSAPVTDQHAQQSRETSPSKPAAAKKKTRTITELATAPYLPPPIPEFDLSTRTARDSLLEYFDSGGEVKALIEHQSVIMSNNKGTAKPTKAKAKPRKKKAGTAEAPILLSPNSALKISSNQDFVFGTSSQLVGEESPTTLRHLQLAIQASNRDDDDPFGKPDSHSRLWKAGARDNDGDLMEVEVVDLAQTPALAKPQPDGCALHSEQMSLDQPQSDDFVDIDNIPLDTPCAQKMAPPTEPSLSSVPVQTAPVAAPAAPDTTATAASSTGAPRPNYEKLTDGQLSRQISSYGFKPVKKRQAMIALLDQCWASKNAGSTSVPAQAISTTATVASPKRKGKATEAPPPPAAAPADPVEKPAKRPRGRPKKNPEAAAASTSASTTTTVSPKSRKSSAAKKPRAPAKKKTTRKAKEIADSASDDEDGGVATPSAASAASSPEPTFSSPPPVDLDFDLDGSDEEDQSLALTAAATTKDARQAELFRHITRAIKTEQRSQYPAAGAEPSWHEKMLLYDPVVLEDLAAWLNAGQLTRVGFDGEADPLDVKAWCEARSVVCLWRKNTRGRERKRY